MARLLGKKLPCPHVCPPAPWPGGRAAWSPASCGSVSGFVCLCLLSRARGLSQLPGACVILHGAPASECLKKNTSIKY